MDEALSQLQAEYCPPLDPALLSAILSDYDLTDKNDLAQARSTLDSLKESAALEEAAGFDASGTGGLQEDVDSTEGDESYNGANTSRSREPDVTSASNQLSSLELEDAATRVNASNSDVESLDEETKAQLLNRVFGNYVTRYSITHTLKACNGSFNAAMEELLNQIYLDESSKDHNGGIFGAKGIDGFADGDGLPRGRRGKGKSKRKHLVERRSSSLSGLEHSSGGSRRPEAGVQIVPVYARPSDVDLDSGLDTPSAKARSANSSRSSSSDGRSATLRKEAYDLARIAALSQATAAHRRAKSDRLMGGAAAYYGEVGREYSALSFNASARAADQLAASQSNATELDLHGIDVRNAVRIAEEKVEEWWEGLGESRVNGRIGAVDRQTGYRVVVGLGKHSEGGHSKLGPAVTKALKQQGWRIEPAGAVIIVKGRAKN